MIEKKQSFQQFYNVGDRSLSQNPEVLPLTGKSRWSKLSKFSPVSRETFRKLSLNGQAPQPERMGVRCTFYDNQELHKWLADPAKYQAQKKK
ncbi:MAG: transcriptional regulator [Pseudomonadota bacterium]